ncbi:TonB-dependent receptor [Sphingobium sp. Sx8-8]|uniref:TonB-dependent receptor n=1 Tax=Sphingobium sp. Sx8-8 TaxID=2933617 RepID=UPI001F5A9666|nr:TonB-dependent receptor [Sphingobium sp. Sx8-8]
MMKRSILFACASGAVLAAVQALPAHAQDQQRQQAEQAPHYEGEIIVTAQKRAENLQNVPIAVSAFSQEMLQKQGLVGGADLKQSIPNVSFGSTGFGKFNFQIRGIGAQIQGAAVDSGVGIHENNIPLNDSRLAAAEFYDIERVEVLRGPQGTLYGRNATGGVVNTITATPKHEFSGEVTGEYGRYDTRKLRGYINIPIGGTLAVRAAGSMIKRDGNILNSYTGNKIDSRDIWSTRLTAQWDPSDSFRARAMWEHFRQHDTSGGNAKIICAPDSGPTSIGGVSTNPVTQALLSGGCLANAASSPANNGTAGSMSLLPGLFGYLFGFTPVNAYAGRTVSTNLNSVNSDFDPSTRAKNDLFSLDLQWKFNDALTLTSLSSYTKDHYTIDMPVVAGVATATFPVTPLTPGGIFNDPQIGAYDHMSARYHQDRFSRQYSQELRIQSSFDGKFDFNLGGIYIDYKQDGDLLALSNMTTLAAAVLNATQGAGIYIDPTSPGDGTGHNYYDNRSPYWLKSGALFGEAYYRATDDLKLTLGLRYTDDRKKQIAYPVVLLTPGAGFPATDEQRVSFKELTGRFTVDWKPKLDFTDDTLLYASVSRGYKGGGFNPAGVAGTGVASSFKPEFVNALEVGTKNMLANRRVTLNLTGFYYDYKGYQISKLVNNTVANENIDARLWGVEFEGGVEPVDHLRFDARVGYLNSRIKGGSSIDTLNPTGGDSSLTAVRSIESATFSNRCVLPTAYLAGVQSAINAGAIPDLAMGSLCSSPLAVAGIPTNLDGKQLPSAPHWTVALGGEYDADFGDGWSGTFRVDYYRQSKSYARIYNDVADRIDAYDNLNLSYRIASDDKGIDLLLYARNLLSQQKIVNILVQGDTLGASRIVNGKERATYGFAITKRF